MDDDADSMIPLHQLDPANDAPQPFAKRKVPSKVIEFDLVASRDPRQDSSPPARLDREKETFLPVYGQVRLSKRELAIIDHPGFQRLFEFRQLGQANFVFRGATHLRGEHAIGTLEAATLFADAIARNNAMGSPPIKSSQYTLSLPLSDTERELVRLGALLHDIGHLPAGHTLEDELGILEPHDADARINVVLAKDKWFGLERVSLGALIDKVYGDEANATGLLSEEGAQLTASQVVVRLISKDYAGRLLKQTRELRDTFRWAVLRDIIGNTLCADLLDYLHRDWLHIGRPRNFDKRILDYVEIRSSWEEATDEQSHTLVLNLGPVGRPRHDAVTATIDLLESRYQLAEIVLFHRTKLVAAAMLERALSEYQDSLDPQPEAHAEAMKALEAVLLECSDQESYSTLAAILNERAEAAPPGQKKRLHAGAILLQRLRIRHLHRQFCSFWADDLGYKDSIQRTYTPNPRIAERSDKIADRRLKARRRLLAVRGVEEAFGLDAGSVAMYCPPPKMNAKLAEVKILWHHDVSPLASKDKAITGGHLETLNQRFEKLWRVVFTIDSTAFDSLNSDPTKLRLFEDTLRFGVLGEAASDHEQYDDKMRDIAERLYGLSNVNKTLPEASSTRDTVFRFASGRAMPQAFRRQ